MVRLIRTTLLFTFKQIFVVTRFATPWIIRFLIFTLGVSIKLSIVAVTSMYRGVDEVAARISEDWKRRAINGGFPYLWEVPLLNVFHVLAIVTIFAGWVTLIFMSVFTIGVALKLIF